MLESSIAQPRPLPHDLVSASQSLRCEVQQPQERSSCLHRMVDSVTSVFIGNEATRREVDNYIVGGIKTAGLFTRGGVGTLAAMAIYAADHIDPTDSAATQAVDGTLGLLHGGALRLAFSGIGGSQLGVGAKGFWLSLTSRTADTLLTRQSYLDSSGSLSWQATSASVLDRVVNPYGLATDAATAMLAHGLFYGANRISHDRIANNKFLATALTGTSFGLVSGASNEMIRQDQAGEQLTLANLGRIAYRSVLQGSVDTLAAAVGSSATDRGIRGDFRNLFSGRSRGNQLGTSLGAGDLTAADGSIIRSTQGASQLAEAGRPVDATASQASDLAGGLERQSSTSRMRPISVTVDAATGARMTFGDRFYEFTDVRTGGRMRLEFPDEGLFGGIPRVLRDVGRMQDTLAGRLAPREFNGSGQHSGSGQTVPADLQVGTFQTEVGGVRRALPIAVLEAPTLLSIMAGRPFGDVGGFAVDLYTTARARMSTQELQAALRDPLALRRLFAARASAVLPEVTQRAAARASGAGEGTAPGSERTGTTGDRPLGEGEAPATRPPAPRRPQTLHEILDEPLRMIGGRSPRVLDGIRISESTGEGTSTEHGFRCTYRGYDGRRHMADLLNGHSIQGILRSPGSLTTPAAELTAADFRRWASDGSVFKRLNHVSGNPLSPLTCEFYARVFRSIGMTPERAQATPAAALPGLFESHLRRLASAEGTDLQAGQRGS